MTQPLYRQSTLGQSLQKALEDMVQEEIIPATLTAAVMDAFDKKVTHSLSKTGLSNLLVTDSETERSSDLEGAIRDGELKSYKYFDNVWIFDMKAANFRGRCFTGVHSRGGGEQLRVDHVKIVACDAKLFRDKCE